MDKQIFKVITPIEKRGGGHYWMKVGSAYRNKDNSINVYLDAIPKGPNLQFQLRELDEEDLRRREAYRAGAAGSGDAGAPAADGYRAGHDNGAATTSSAVPF